MYTCMYVALDSCGKKIKYAIVNKASKYLHSTTFKKYYQHITCGKAFFSEPFTVKIPPLHVNQLPEGHHIKLKGVLNQIHTK